MLLAVALLGCGQDGDAVAQEAQATGAAGAETTEAVPVEPGAHGECPQKNEQAAAHDCTHGAGGTELVADEVQRRRDGEGNEYQHVGLEFSEVPEVAVAELVADPGKFRGQVVQVRGNVAAMCTDRRGWFAVTDKDDSGAQLRVITVPTFLVPAESVGLEARAEGTVDVVEIPAEQARHFGAEHKLVVGPEVNGVVHQVIVRATAADFL